LRAEHPPAEVVDAFVENADEPDVLAAGMLQLGDASSSKSDRIQGKGADRRETGDRVRWHPAQQFSMAG
jgi:hypothetical protein